MAEMTRYARPESVGRCHCMELRKASRRISQLYDTALAPSGLKTTQRAILSEIGRSEPTTVGALADALVMDAGSLAHHLINACEKALKRFLSKIIVLATP
jgi:hypothetical protein